MAITLYGNEVASSKAMTQVYDATHRGDGLRLPYMNRSFISFSFGGKYIEDFGLIAVTNGDRISRDGSSNFDNLTTSYEVVNGQLYWGTYFQGNTLHLNLATDGITQRQLDDFLHWFRGGETRELILSEHPNRGIFARVAEPPALSLLPFEQQTSFKVQYDTFKTSTTLYRGEIELVFQMDEPFWHAIENIFGYYDEETGIYHDTFIDANGIERSIFDSNNNKDAVKVMLEDGIPFSSMIQDNMLLGNNIVANTGTEGGAIIAEDSFIFQFVPLVDGEEPENTENITFTEFRADYYRVLIMVLEDPSDLSNEDNPVIPIFENSPAYSVVFNDALTEFPNSTVESDFRKAFNYDQITVDAIKNTVLVELNSHLTYSTEQWDDPNVSTHVHIDERYATRVQGVYMTGNGGIETLSPGTNASDKYYFYYAGTAPAYPILQFSLELSFNSDGYIDSPCNSFAPSDEGENYNTFSIESQSAQTFKFTTSNIYTSFNTAIQIFNNHTNADPKDLYTLIWDNVKHYAVRAWATRILDFCDNNSIIINEESSGFDINELMKMMFCDSNGDFLDLAHFSFDSKNGIATGIFTIRDCTTADTVPNTIEEWDDYCAGEDTIIELTENVGDMVKSNWLVIKERNSPDENNLIRAWDNTTTDIYGNKIGRVYSHRIYHDVTKGLYNVKLIYNNMYV